jgi:lysophospholipase L1-like esterase
MMHGSVDDSVVATQAVATIVRNQFQEVRLLTPTEYAILVKAGELMRPYSCKFFSVMPNSPIWRIAVAALVCGSIGCTKSGGGGPMEPSGPPAAGSTIVYTALGASDANGVGSSVECLFLSDCPNGMGYVPVTVRQLRARGFTVTHLNLGIPTAVIGRDFQTLGQQYNRTILGTLIEQEMNFVQQNATVVTIFAGINEVNVITAALGGGAGGSDPNGYIDAQVRAFGTDYMTLLAGVRARASSPRIIVLNVPNAAGLPFLASASLAQRQAAQRASVGMTRTVVNGLVGQNAVVVDLMCDTRSYLASNYSFDGLHPNDAGYAFIAGEVVRAITAGSYPSPQSSCGAMALVP